MEDAHTNTQIPSPPPPELKRTEGFSFHYANHVQVESNAFDLKLIFGMTDLRDNAKPVVEQFAAVNLSWPEAKLLIYWMQLHLAGHEKENGKIKIPSAALPPEIPSTPPAQFDNSKGREIFELMRKIRAEFIASLSES